MTVKELIEKDLFEVINVGENVDHQITKPFCCDLLSIAMSKATEGAAWVTVMANINTLAVASLTESAVVVLAEGVALDDVAKEKAVTQGITVLATDKPIYETAVAIGELLK